MARTFVLRRSQPEHHWRAPDGVRLPGRRQRAGEVQRDHHGQRRGRVDEVNTYQ